MLFLFNRIGKFEVRKISDRRLMTVSTKDPIVILSHNNKIRDSLKSSFEKTPSRSRHEIEQQEEEEILNNKLLQCKEEGSKLIRISGLHSLEDIKCDFGVCCSATHVDLSGNFKLKRIGDSFSTLFNLQTLELAYCGLVEFPEALLSLSCLRKLRLSNNDIRLIPSDLSGMKSLEFIDLDSNYIQSIPATLLRLDIKHFLVDNNPLFELGTPASEVPFPKKVKKCSICQSDLTTIISSPKVFLTFKTYFGVPSAPIHYFLHPSDSCYDLLVEAAKTETAVSSFF